MVRISGLEQGPRKFDLMFNAKVNNLEKQFGGLQTTENNSEELE